MSTITAPNPTVDASPSPAALRRPITQYSRRQVFAIWAAAALPMAALSWIVAPAIAGGSSAGSLFKPLLTCMVVGLTWQLVLVVALVGREQRSLRWSSLKDALWLRAPRSPKTGRVGGRLWLIVFPLIVGAALLSEQIVPIPTNRDLGEFLQTDTAAAIFDGSFLWFGVFMAMGILNTVIGEELLFRGVLLPRMRDAFKRDWLANGVLFGVYHLHMPWRIPGSVLEGCFIAGAVKRYRSAWLGILVHSAQTVVIGLIILSLVV